MTVQGMMKARSDAKRKRPIAAKDIGVGTATAGPEGKSSGAKSHARPTPAVTFQGELRQVFLDDLVPTADNPRIFNDPAKHQELVDSIRALGVLNPLLARPHPEQAGKLDLRAGHRRLKAAAAVGLPTVPVLVRDMTHREAAEVSAAENLQREDLHPLEESRSIDLMLRVGWDTASIASRFGKTASWVARRSSLGRLHPKVRDLITGDDQAHPLARAPVGIYERLARLPDQQQLDVLARWKRDKWRAEDECRDVQAFESGVMKQTLHKLRGVIWKLDDAMLDPKAGSCVACPKRTGVEPLLWDEAEEDKRHIDRCLDPECFQRKELTALKLRVAVKTQELDGLMYLVAENHLPSDELSKLADKFGIKARTIVVWHQFTEVAKSHSGAKPAIVIQGPGLGGIKWGMRRSQQTEQQAASRRKGYGSVGKNPQRTAAEVRGEIAGRRVLRTAQALAKVVDEMAKSKVRPESLPAQINAAAFAIEFALSDEAKYPHGLSATWKKPWKAVAGYDRMSASEMDWALLRAVLPSLADRVEYGPSAGCTLQIGEEMERLSTLLGIDLQPLREQAEKDIPMPSLPSKGKMKGKPAKTRSAKGTKRPIDPEDEGDDADGDEQE